MITDKQVDEAMEKLRIALDAKTPEDLMQKIEDQMVDRFLCWKLPKAFCPDAGISFKPSKPDAYDAPGWWPIGTNLFTADQAREMVRHMLCVPDVEK